MGNPLSRKRWGIVVIGCGSIGLVHMRALEALGRSRLVGVSSRRVERAQEVAQGAEGCVATADPAELLRRSDVEIVCITTSSGSHAPLATAALEAGKHVVLEKPMAMRAADARRLVDLAAARGLTLSVISQRRFEPAHRAVRRLLDDGTLGKLLLVEAACPYYRTDAYYGSADWRGTIAEDGGALMNQGIHSVDLMLWLGGPASSVFGRIATQTHAIEAEDLAVAVVTFANGAIGNIMASTSIQPGFSPTLGIYGEKGTVRLEGANVTHWTVPGVSPPDLGGAQASAGVATPQLASDEHHRAQLADILDAIETGRPPAVTPEDGLRAVELVEGVYRSAATNAPVPLGRA